MMVILARGRGVVVLKARAAETGATAARRKTEEKDMFACLLVRYVVGEELKLGTGAASVWVGVDKAGTGGLSFGMLVASRRFVSKP